MALAFPVNPTNGQTFNQYVYSTSIGAWQNQNDPTNVASLITNKANLAGGNVFSGYQLTSSQSKFQAFGATGTSGTSGQDWIFPFTYVNVGSNYNASNGRFTAPISGTYMFFWSNIGGTVNTVYRYFIRKNGVNIDDVHLRLETGTTSYKENGDRTAIINLNQGDYVNIHFLSDTGTGSFTTGQYPWFGGLLIG